MRTLSFRTSEETKRKLDMLASEKKRDRSFIINEDIDYYLALQEWQIAHIKEGIKQARKKQFASDAEVSKAFDKWTK